MVLQPHTTVLHLVGSPTSQFYFDLSVMYGRTCTDFKRLDRTHFTHKFAVVYLNGKWSFPAELDDATVKEAEQGAITVGAALAKIESMQPAVDVVVPHMFCLEGLTRYRALCDSLNIEVLGCSPEACSIGQDKYLTKTVCQDAGVCVPKGELLRKDIHGADLEGTATKILERHSIPFIVKPNREDNSIGLSLVRTGTIEAVTAALSKGFQYDEQILVEEYIAGRECRVGVLEVEEGDDLKMLVLPKLEYVLEDIREQKHKYGTDANGNLLTGDKNVSEAFEKAREEGERICPAQFEPKVHARLDDLAKRAHKALGCKYYSLYDVRIDKDGTPFMLESCLFCSFSPYSVIISLAAKMTENELQHHPEIFEMFLDRAANETRARRAACADAGKDSPSLRGGVKKRKLLN